ncbi:MAG: linear amide C-N hydrolase [Clostridia bacterium]|nr:linear amide C-N hydrolase [Clostridia bacterium]
MKTKRLRALICAVLAAMMTLPALSCAKEEVEPFPAGQAEMPAAEAQKTDDEENPAEEVQDAPADAETEPETARDTDLHDERVTPPESGMLEVEKNMFLAKVGDCGFSAFLAGGGASSDADVVAFLTAHLSVPGLDFAQIGAGCSTVAAQSADGGHVFGRNFDWSSAQVLMLEAHPSDGYASFSTVNLDFLRESARLPDEAIPMASYYAPLDGMNEKGLAVSVNMISDTARIAQSTDKPDLTTTTALRLLLDRAATVDEALALLESYDLHGSYDMMIHFAVADLTGRAVDVEYVGQEMVVIETPILTNFYLAEGEKHGIGSEESHRRFDALEAFMAEHEKADIYDVRDALMTARESAFDPDPSEGTEWSVLYDQTNLTATWYRREKFDAGWTVELGK